MDIDPDISGNLIVHLDTFAIQDQVARNVDSKRPSKWLAASLTNPKSTK